LWLTRALFTRNGPREISLIDRNPNQALQGPAFKAFGSIPGGSSEPPRRFESGRKTRRLRRITLGKGTDKEKGEKEGLKKRRVIIYLTAITAKFFLLFSKE
jgi:hypothetical protein